VQRGSRGSVDYSGREFPMTEENFKAIQNMAFDCTGIKLTEHKKEMIYSRLARRIRNLGFENFSQYCDVIAYADHPEHNEFVNTITTNLTSFYREPHHFEFFAKEVIPFLKKSGALKKRIRIWSAGCSTGEEPYTIAAVLLRYMQVTGWDCKILATDLDENCLNKAKSAVYAEERADGLSDERFKSLFQNIKTKDSLMIKKNLQELIFFKRLNLMESWPMKGPFDVLFCRNVVIYFDKDTQRKLFDRFANMLNPGAFLFIGHSESLNGVSKRFELIGKTTYRFKG